MRVLVVGDRGDDDWGFVGERLLERDAHLVRLDRDALPSWADIAGDGADLVLLLGSARSAHLPANAAVVEAESALTRAALDDATPVLAICYGAQLAAYALGGSVGVSPVPEIGMFAHQSYDPVLCPPGPWAQLHSDAFISPPTARVLGASAAGCQGFADESRPGRVLAWQFHPEVTAQEFCTWLDQMDAWARDRGVDVAAVREQVAAHADEMRAPAHELTDAALAYLVQDRADGAR